LRLSATPNGKNQKSDIRNQISDVTFARVRQTLSFSEDTSCGTPRGRPLGRPRSPATVTQLASLRWSINNAPPPIPTGMAAGKPRSSCRVFRSFARTGCNRLSRFASQTAVGATGR